MKSDCEWPRIARAAIKQVAIQTGGAEVKGANQTRAVRSCNP